MMTDKLGIVLILLAANSSVKAMEKGPGTDVYGDPLPPGALARLGTLRLRHLYAAVRFTRDGKELISAGGDGMVRYWDPASGKEKRRMHLRVGDSPDQSNAYTLYRFSADGRSVAGCYSHHIFVWDAATGKELKRFPLGKVSIPGREHIPIQVFRLFLSPDGKKVAASLYNSEDHTIRLWSVSTGMPLFTRKIREFCNSLAISPDGKLLGAISNPEGLLLWDIESGKESRKIADARGFLAFSPDGKQVAAPTRAGGVKGWNVADGKQCFEIKPIPGRYLDFPTFAADNKTLAVYAYGGNGEELLWNLASGKQLHAIPVQSAQMAFSPDSKTAAFHGTAIRLWDVASGKEIGPRAGHTDAVSSLSVAPDGSSIATISFRDRAVHLWDAGSGRLLLAVPAHKRYVRSAVFSPEGRFFITGGDENILGMWDRNTGKELQQFLIESADLARTNLHVMELALSSDGKRLVALVGNGITGRTRKVLVWDALTGKLLHQRSLAWFGYRMRFSPDARSMAIQRGRDVVVEDVSTGSEIVKVAGREPLAFSPDGQIVALAEPKPKSPASGRAAEQPGEVSAVCLVEMATGKPLLRIATGPVGFRLLAYSPDGRALATANRDRFCLWDAATGRELFHCDLPEQYRGSLSLISFATSLAFLPSGDRLATGLMDSTTLIWDLQPKNWHAGIAGKKLEQGDLERLWSDLTGDDAAKTHRAVWTLSAVPTQAVPFLKEHLHAVAELDIEQVQHLIADLDSPGFATREQARKKLASFGELAEPTLRKALAGKPSLEARRRLEALLADAEKAGRGLVHSTEVLRTLRAIRALEQMGDREARQLLHTLSGGAAGARQTRMAKEALRRLEPRR